MKEIKNVKPSPGDTQLGHWKQQKTKKKTS